MWSRSCLSALNELVPEHHVSQTDLDEATSRGFPWHAPDLSYEEIAESREWWAHIDRRIHELLRALGVPGDLYAVSNWVRKDILDASRYSLYGDVVPALERVASSGWRQIVVSNHVPELDEILHGLGLTTFFAQVLSSARVGFEKPHPELFRRALQLAVPGRPVWMIGDSVVSDCLPARALGIRAILVRTPSTEYEPCAEGLVDAVRMVLESN